MWMCAEIAVLTLTEFIYCQWLYDTQPQLRQLLENRNTLLFKSTTELRNKSPVQLAARLDQLLHKKIRPKWIRDNKYALIFLDDFVPMLEQDRENIDHNWELLCNQKDKSYLDYIPNQRYNSNLDGLELTQWMVADFYHQLNTDNEIDTELAEFNKNRRKRVNLPDTWNHSSKSSKSFEGSVKDKYGHGYNCIDILQDSDVDTIRKESNKNKLNYQVYLNNVVGSINVGSIIRTAAYFNCQKVVYYQESKKFDRRYCVGMQNYIEIEHTKQNLNEFLKRVNIYPVFVEQGGVLLSKTVLKELVIKSDNKQICFIFGNETNGILRCDMKGYPIITIEQYNIVPRSLNVCVSSGIIFHMFNEIK
jgi:tRNA(Leu) C34 or U34 (ribose-2'-O)-methylase TrmL